MCTLKIPCALTLVPLAQADLLKRAVLMHVMGPSSSLALYFHCLWMFNEASLLPFSPGCIKAEGTVEKCPET